nr:NADH dehydrogenase subunit 6 [Ahnfeltia plicata]
MNTDTTLFYLFSSLALASAVMVIGLSNAVHSVLFLIIVFCNVAGLLLLLGAEFLSFMLLIVYVGAIAVLFLFVVMMLNVKTNPINASSLSVLPIGSLICLILVAQIYSVIDMNLVFFDSIESNPKWISWAAETNGISNIEVVGSVLYTSFSLLFLVCGLILLVSMIGAIVLTMHQRTNVKKQRIETQLSRNPGGVIKFITLRK